MISGYFVNDIMISVTFQSDRDFWRIYLQAGFHGPPLRVCHSSASMAILGYPVVRHTQVSYCFLMYPQCIPIYRGCRPSMSLFHPVDMLHLTRHPRRSMKFTNLWFHRQTTFFSRIFKSYSHHLPLFYEVFLPLGRDTKRL